MDNLKPCPFCGNEPTLYQDEMTGHWAVRCVKDTHRPTLLNSHGATAWCYSCTDPAEATAAWNTRAERTCRVDGGYTYGERDELRAWALSCGHEFDWNDEEPPKYCPSCGAKVVNTDE